MHAFAALLDSPDLHALAQRQAEADRRLSARHARSRSRLGDGGADRRARSAGGQAGGDPRADRGARRSGAVPDEPRLCRRYRGDGRAALARRRRSPVEPDAAVDRARSVERLAALSRADAPAALAAMLDRLDADERFALLKMATGALRDRRLGAAGQDRAGAGVRARCRCGRGGVARARRRPMPRCSPGPRGAGEQPTAADVPVFRPFMLAHPLEDAARRPRRLCRRVEMGRHPRPDRPCRAARRGSTAAPATTSPAAFPKSPRAFRDAGRARRRTAGEGRGAGRRDEHGGGAPASTRCSSGSGARPCRRRCWPTIPAFVRLYDILFDGAEDLRALPWTERRARLEAFVAAARSRAVRPVSA